MSNRVTLDIFLQRCKNIHGEKYDYSESNYEKVNKKIKIICPIHGEFWQLPYRHMSGSGCRECYEENRKIGKNEFINRAINVHGEKYDYSKVTYKNSKTNVCIICPIHGKFFQAPYRHMIGNGCPKCVGKNRDTQDFIDSARQIHGNKYNYSKTYFCGVMNKVTIICPIHGEFQQIAHNHLCGSGCYKCGLESMADKERITKDNFLDRCKIIHGNKYSYEKATFKTTRDYICIICPIHGEFTQKVNSHLNGTGCPKCAHISSSYEEYLYEKLINIFGKENIIREYNKDKRYPYHCDFYIIPRDMFIEINGFWVHNTHWFDKTNENDLNTLKKWEGKSSSNIYNVAINIWTNLDLKKRKVAEENKLNYVVFWGNCKKDIDKWINDGCPNKKDWE